MTPPCHRRPSLRTQHSADSAPTGLQRQLVQLRLLLGQQLTVRLLVEALVEVHPAENGRLGLDITEHRGGKRRPSSGFLLQSRRQRRKNRAGHCQVAVPVIGRLNDGPRRTRTTGLAQDPFSDRQNRINSSSAAQSLWSMNHPDSGSFSARWSFFRCLPAGCAGRTSAPGHRRRPASPAWTRCG